jgi:ubiquinone/menaquinone biosynthesis C-methylase UbiE
MIKPLELRQSSGFMVNDNNQTVYTSQGIVQHYAQLNALQPAEATILDRLKSQLKDQPNLKMLDIGVGGGRTTMHFAPIVSDYVGIDYSSEMVAACHQRFLSVDPSIQFMVCDARDMRQFADNSFDFMLFSFNGIDYVSHVDRLQILQEIHRVGKPGSHFCFSSHNLAGFEREFSLSHQLRFNPLTTYVNLVMLAILRGCNRSLTRDALKAVDYAIIRDESHNFRLNTYYIRPQYQLVQLAPHFHNIQIYSWQQGHELTSMTDGAAIADLWLYYLCQIQKPEC